MMTETQIKQKAIELIPMLNQINMDCAISDESVVPLVDWEYYTEQLINMELGMTDDEAMAVAKMIASLVE